MHKLIMHIIKKHGPIQNTAYTFILITIEFIQINII
jgi:hypothetical protein